MARRGSVTLEGGEELIKRLGKLPEAVAGKAMDDALMAGAEIVRADASRRAPRRTGKLAESIVAELQEGKSGRKSAVIGPNEEAFYGSFVELGRSNQAAQPYLRPALDENKNAVQRAIADALRAAIEKAVRSP